MKNDLKLLYVKEILGKEFDVYPRGKQRTSRIQKTSRDFNT
jgi:hypothetical protein